MNDHQLLCFLTVSRTLNFTTAARELYCTQPALSYQIRSLEKELDLALFERSTTRVALTEAGRAFVPQAEGIYRSILNARTALKGFARRRTLTLRLPPVLLQRDPIYPILMARLHAALPGYEFAVDTRPVSRNPHEMLCSEADAALYLPFGPLQPEIERTPILHNTFYLIISPEHPLTGRSTLALADLAGQQLFYEPLYQEMVDLAVVQPGLPFSAPSWHMVENYECVYNDLLAGRGMFLCPMKYPAFPAAWYLPLQLPLPDTCLLTLRDDPRPEIQRLREVFTRRDFLKVTGAAAAAAALTACGGSSSTASSAASGTASSAASSAVAKLDKVKVAVPNDTTNEARALTLLEKNGFFKLKADAGLTATAKDIEENPLNVSVDEVEAAQVPNVLQDEDYAVINSNYAISAGLDPMTDALAMEDGTSAYVNILVCKDGNQEEPKIKALAAALQSQKVKDFMDENYKGAVVSVVENPTDGYDSSIDYDALNGETVSCAATPAPHCEVLEICKDILAEKGITLDIQEYDDYIIPNNIVEDGQCDTNCFQHQPYLDDFNAEHGTHLVTVAGIHVEPMGIYGGKQDSLAPIEG